MTDDRNTPPNVREQRLGELLVTVDVSAPSIVKFDPIKEWAAGLIDTEARRIAVYYVSKAGNFDVRFRQPGVLRDNPRLGIALIPPGQKLETFLTPARRQVESGAFEAMVVCEGEKSTWHGIAAFRGRDSTIDATVAGLVSASDVSIVERRRAEDGAVTPPSEGARPYALGSVPNKASASASMLIQGFWKGALRWRNESGG